MQVIKFKSLNSTMLVFFFLTSCTQPLKPTKVAILRPGQMPANAAAVPSCDMVFIWSDNSTHAISTTLATSPHCNKLVLKIQPMIIYTQQH